MNYEQRVKSFTELFGEKQGREILTLYENSRLLKNQNKAFDKFIDNISGVSLEKRAKLKERLATRVKEKQQIIQDEELLSIVRETLDRKYDLDIPDEALFKITKIQQEIPFLEAKAKGTPDGSLEKLAWGEKIVEISDIVADLKQVAHSLKGELKLSSQRIAGRVRDKEYFAAAGQTLEELATFAFHPALKSIKASLDNSVLFRQGLKVLSASPETWIRNASKTWKMWAKVGSKSEMEKMSKAFKADLVTRDLYQAAIKAKLAIGVVEDFFPTSIVQKIPGLGNLFKASDEAFTMFSQGSRMDLFEKYVNLYKEANLGKLPDAEVMKQFAKVANSTTGRGGLKSFEASSSLLNQILFSARYQTAQINTVRHAFMAGPAGQVARKQLGRHLLMMGGIMTTLSMFGDVGWNPKENTFGKFRLPGSKKWVDVTGGLASYVALMGRIEDKLSSKPEYKDTAMNIVVDFMKGKLAPAPGALRDILEQRDYQGRKPTPLTIAESLFVPISVNNPIQDTENNIDAMTTTFSAFLESLGFSTTTPKARSEGSYWSPNDLLE